MDNLTPDFRSLAFRVEKLEKQNRLYRRGGLLLLLSTAALIVMGQMQPTRNLVAQSVVLTDSNGIKRAELSMVNGYPTLRFFDAEGKTRIALDASSESPNFGPRIWMASEDESSRLTLGLVGKYPFVLVKDGQGFSAQLGTTPDIIDVRTGAASLIMWGKDGKPLWLAPKRP
jgi:hypothetical protein